MGIIVFLSILVLLILVGLGAGFAKVKAGFVVGGVSFGLLLLVLIFTTFTQVHAKQIGVVVSFGKPVKQLDAGLHLKAPWQSVTKIDETIFTDSYGGDHLLPVRLGDGNTAGVSATIRWHVNPAAADYIYATYRSDNPAEDLRDAVVHTQFQAAVNQIFAGFDPTAGAEKSSAGSSATFSPDYVGMAKGITELMNSQVKDAEGLPLIVVDGITVAGISYSTPTEARINSIIAQVAKTQQAKLAQETATEQAKANGILQASLAKNPNVLVAQCLDDLAAGKFKAPAGFSCWPGAGSSVVIPSATN